MAGVWSPRDALTSSPRFVLRAVTIAPGRELPYDGAEWRGALVVVDRGAIDLESVHGARWRFGRGAMLWLAGLPVRALCNGGNEPARLIAVSCRSDEFLSASRL
jgi:hypothetical protein